LPVGSCGTLGIRSSLDCPEEALREELPHPQPGAAGAPSKRSLTATSKYTSALWREVQARGRVPEVVAQQISHSPVRFRVTVRFGEAQGSGEGQSKKAAKHLASREVCDQLGIRV
jgi:hypothetical protein